MTLLLSRDSIERVLNMREAIEIVRDGFAELTAGHVTMPQRLVIPVPQYEGVTVFMPAYVAKTGALAIKTVSVFKENPRRHELPAIMGTIALLDDRTGEPVCIMDAGYITAMRTGAASGVATDLLAGRNARVAAIFGAGVQGRTQLMAMCEVRDIEKVWVYDVHVEAARKFAQEMRDTGRIPEDVTVAHNPAEAVGNADVICTATTSPTPIFDGHDIMPGAHINAVGSHMPTVRELDTETVVRSTVICDLVDACLAEAGDLLIPMKEGRFKGEDIYGSLGEIVLGQKSGRESDEQITLFKSVGLAFQDAVTASHVYQRARQEGVGTEFSF